MSNMYPNYSHMDNQIVYIKGLHLPVLHHSVVYISSSFVIRPHVVSFENLYEVH